MDPFGLFSVSVRETLEVVKSLPNNRGGYTKSAPPVSKCGCVESCGSWTLSECSTSIEIHVQLRGSVSDFAERRFYATSEYQHVRDIRSVLDYMQRAGESIESIEKKRSFPTQAQCEGSAYQLVQDTMDGILLEAIAKSREYWDRGDRHTWRSPGRWFLGH
jgi:hypothetical protein